jgi:hypothetical protein
LEENALKKGEGCQFKDHLTTVLGELATKIQTAQELGAKAFAAGDYKLVEEQKQLAESLTRYRTETEKLLQLLPQENSQKRGSRTPESMFYIPILRVIVSLGGRGRVREILPLVEGEMKESLGFRDYETMKNDSDQPRWANTVRWARDSLVKEGLLEKGSPRGIWEISEAGRQKLEESFNR